MKLTSCILFLQTSRRVAKSIIEGYTAPDRLTTHAVSPFDARPPGTTQSQPDHTNSLQYAHTSYIQRLHPASAPIIKSRMRDGRRQRHLRLRRRGHRNANANDRLATTTSPSVLDVMGSESSNDDKPVLDIRSTGPWLAPWRGYFHDSTLHDISSVSRTNGRPRFGQIGWGGTGRERVPSSRRLSPWFASRRKIEAMGPWPFCWGVFFGTSETSEIGCCAREKKRGNRNIGICCTGLLISTITIYDAISLPRSNMLWHHGSMGAHPRAQSPEEAGIGLRLAIPTTYAPILGLFQPCPKTVRDPGRVLEQAAPGELLYCTTCRISVHRLCMLPRALVGLNLPRTSLCSNGTVYCGDDIIGPDYCHNQEYAASRQSC